jgi:topoisomerase IV subunit B
MATQRQRISRDAAAAKLGGKPEITRFKGLGEISPNEFKQFIGKEMRLRC